MTVFDVNWGGSNGIAVSAAAVGSAPILTNNGAVESGGLRGPGSQSAQNVSSPDIGAISRNTNPAGEPQAGISSGEKAPIFGKPQISRKTPGHDTTSARIAGEAARNPRTESVHLNRKLTSILKDRSASGKQPDVAIVNKDGTVDLVEVRSSGQTRASQEQKLESLRRLKNMPPGRNVVVDVDNQSAAPMRRGVGGGAVGRGLGAVGLPLLIFHEYVNQIVEKREQAQCLPPDCA